MSLLLQLASLVSSDLIASPVPRRSGGEEGGAYSNLIDVVHRLTDYARFHYDRELGEENPSKEEKEKIEKVEGIQRRVPKTQRFSGLSRK